VRDLLLGKTPKDWDIATNAKPEEILGLFQDAAFYENAFGTVGVKTGSDDQTLRVIEVTTFRIDSKYSDRRRPDEVLFSDTIEEDVKRRDFTINAMALGWEGELVDQFDGQADLKAKLIRTVGRPEDRFREDALRMIRAIRLAVELGCTIEPDTSAAIQAQADLVQHVSRERIRDELTRILMQAEAVRGLELLRTANLLIEMMPELLQGYGVGQNKHHRYDVYEHSLRALEYAAAKKFPLELRLAALLHDIGKPLTKQGDGPDCTFYNHEIIGAKLARHMLTRLRFSNETIRTVTHLVRYHMFYFELEAVTPAAVRRFARRVGEEYLEDLFKLREADRIGSGVPKAVPYRLRYLKYLIKKVSVEPIKPTMVQLRGDEVMKILNIPPSPRVGWVLKALLEEVLDDPKRNKPEYLKQRAAELGQLADEELQKLALGAEEKKDAIEAEMDEQLKDEFYVK